MVFDAIKELIADRTGCEPDDIAMDTKFADLGIDSLDTVEMLMDLSDKIGEEVELDEKVETVGELVEFIESKIG